MKLDLKISKDRAIPEFFKRYIFFNSLCARDWVFGRWRRPPLSAQRQDLPFVARKEMSVIASREYGLY
jgi:hypothetical protein